ncbi:hypothetical protein JAAARDRAFT_197571 [Jaapia argillacea MUCL 33604]|uniref:F-box domain-containing protein n=1 Tax=Jaapia argillacea MUCL 33604 TaxID=933084 RepID=A0A067PF99_9AGAM|nr:hypothetical protein JAAARDRAFT_197571 [Jaapia argillacea MUCL 33604]
MQHAGMSYARVFSIAELSREICWYLHHDSKPSLANLAQTCRSFLEPALDVLWFKMFDMRPLLDLIPALEVVPDSDDEIEVTDRGEPVSYYDISYPLEEEDWSRFDFYAPRIRILEFIHHGKLTATSTLDSLNIPPLPTYCPHYTFASVASEVSPFLTPGLQTLCIRNQYDDDIVWTDPVPIPSEEEEILVIFFHMLPRRCPAVEHLALSGDLQHLAFGCLKKFQNLNEIELGGHSTKVGNLSITLEAMSALPHLEKIIDIEMSGGPGVVSCDPGFPSLSSISTHYGNPTNLLATLRSISSPSLQSFSSLYLVEGSRRALLSCASLLVSKFSTTLQQVVIHTSHRYAVEDVGLPIFDILLRGLPHLRTFALTLAVEHIDLPEWPTMTEDNVENMTLAWPHMENLTIQHSISFPSLKTITHAWPNLTSLTIPHLYISPPDLQLTYEAHSLRNLSVDMFHHGCPSSPPDEDVARVIDAMFPKLEVGPLPCLRCQVMRNVAELQKGRPSREG